MPIRSRDLAEGMGRSMPWARARLARMVEAGWLIQHGRTRAATYVAAERLTSLDLRLPDRIRRYDGGLSLDDGDGVAPSAPDA